MSFQQIPFKQMSLKRTSSKKTNSNAAIPFCRAPIRRPSMPRGNDKKLKNDQTEGAVPQPKDSSFDLAHYAYSEVPPDENPAEIVWNRCGYSGRDARRQDKAASDAFGLDFTFMKAVARIESDSIPSGGPDDIAYPARNYEFAMFGSATLPAPATCHRARLQVRDRVVLFEIDPTLSRLCRPIRL